MKILSAEQRQKRNLYQQAYLRKNRERFRRRFREQGKRYLKILRLQVLKRYGDKCVKCGFDDWRALQIDHIEGGGNREYKKLCWTAYLRHVRDDITGKYQLLCANCNWIKKHENGEVSKGHIH